MKKLLLILMLTVSGWSAQDTIYCSSKNAAAARCKMYNPKVGGKDGSTHLPEWDRTGFLRGKGGCGFDIRNDRKLEFNKRQTIIEKATYCGFKGLGFANTFIHIDDAKRDKLTEWWY